MITTADDPAVANAGSNHFVSSLASARCDGARRRCRPLLAPGRGGRRPAGVEQSDAGELHAVGLGAAAHCARGAEVVEAVAEAGGGGGRRPAAAAGGGGGRGGRRRARRRRRARIVRWRRGRGRGAGGAGGRAGGAARAPPVKVKRYSPLSRQADSGSTGAAPTPTSNEPYDAERVLGRLPTTDSAPTWVKPPHVFSTPTVHATGSRSFFLFSVKNSYCAGTPGTVTRSVDEPTVLAGEANESSRHCVLVDAVEEVLARRRLHRRPRRRARRPRQLGAADAVQNEPPERHRDVGQADLAEGELQVVDSDRRRSDGGAAVRGRSRRRGGAARQRCGEQAAEEPRGARRRLLDMAVNYLRPAEVRRVSETWQRPQLRLGNRKEGGAKIHLLTPRKPRGRGLQRRGQSGAGSA